MEHSEYQEEPPHEEQELTPQRKFNILFPRSNYDELPVIDPRNAGWLISKITLDPDKIERGYGFLMKLKNNSGMTQIVPFTPDKLRNWAETLSYGTSNKSFHRLEFDEILKPEETTGGTLMLDMLQVIPDKLLDLIEERYPETKTELATASSKLPKIYMIGVYNRHTGQPTRIIYHIEGDRPKGRRKKVQDPTPQLIPTFQTI